MSEVTKVLGEERPVQERAGSANVAEEPMVDSNEVLETYVLVKQRIIMVLTEANGIPPDEPTVQKLARLLVAGFFQRNQRGAPALG